MREMLNCKIHGGTVTASDIDYEGSCGLGPDLLKASGLLPFEKISVLNVSNGTARCVARGVHHVDLLDVHW